MKSELLLSVIVPAYNVAEWLPRCLDSILAQTYRNIEILVIDDGSTDETPQIIDRYASRNPPIRAFHQQNRGLVETRERGIQEAKGEYIGFVDGDDEIIPEMYEKLVENAVRYQAQISQCGILYCFYDGRRIPIHGTGKLTVYEHTEGCAALLRGTEMEPSLCNKIYEASLVRSSCLDASIVNNEDMLRNIVLFDRAERSVMEDFCGYLYWRRKESMSNNQKTVTMGKNILLARERILEYVSDELKSEAQNNCSFGAVSVYNSLLGNRSNEAAELRQQCRDMLRDGRQARKDLPRKMRAKIFAILHLPFSYEMAQKMHEKERKRRIKKQADQAKRASTGGEEQA